MTERTLSASLSALRSSSLKYVPSSSSARRSALSNLTYPVLASTTIHLTCGMDMSATSSLASSFASTPSRRGTLARPSVMRTM